MGVIGAYNVGNTRLVKKLSVADRAIHGFHVAVLDSVKHRVLLLRPRDHESAPLAHLRLRIERRKSPAPRLAHRR